MKKLTILLMLAITLFQSASAQKKANGEIFITHPAINVVNDFFKAFEAGDSAKMASYLTDDFKAYNGTTNHVDGDVRDKATFLSGAIKYKERLDYFSCINFPGSYPDGLEYQKDNKNGEITVLTWNLIKGIHKKTGVKIDAASHSNFTLTKDNKIKTLMIYSNSKVFDEIAASMTPRTNGKIYNHHENINTVRKAMYYFEKGNFDKSLSLYADNASFYDINDPFNQKHDKTQERANMENFHKAFEIVNIEEIGYPDYLEYEMNDGREVLAWWKLILVRKSDKKKITLAMHTSNSFDADGNIISEILYYSQALLEAK